jgi:preprotein translocase subunit SecD
MQRRTLVLLLLILVLAGGAVYTVYPNNSGLHIGWLGIHHPLQVKQGLDLQGGVRVLLVPDPAQVTGRRRSSERLMRRGTRLNSASTVGLASTNQLFACKRAMGNRVSP